MRPLPILGVSLDLLRSSVAFVTLLAPGCLVNDALYRERLAELADGDGDLVRAEFDCDDHDATVHDGAHEVCDGLDNDCDGSVDEDLEIFVSYLDADGDGVGNTDAPVARCDDLVPSGYVSIPGDCDDEDPGAYPDATEVCDGVDNDCDTEVDEDVTVVAFPDLDGDGYGDPSATPQTACSVPAGHTLDATDCDDTDPATNPGAAEATADGTCFDGVDNDCDGAVDYVDADGDGDAKLLCGGSDCDDTDPENAIYDSVGGPAAEDCADGQDNDCDTRVDWDDNDCYE